MAVIEDFTETERDDRAMIYRYAWTNIREFVSFAGKYNNVSSVVGSGLWLTIGRLVTDIRDEVGGVD